MGLDWIGLDWNGLELMRLDWVVVPTFAVKSVAIAVAMFTAPEGHADVGIGGVIVHRQLAGLRPSVKRLLQNSPAQHAPPHCLSVHTVSVSSHSTYPHTVCQFTHCLSIHTVSVNSHSTYPPTVSVIFTQCLSIHTAWL